MFIFSPILNNNSYNNLSVYKRKREGYNCCKI
nr:MAG TPA: hypothetical protein [Caudoviricetes sp.]